MGPAPPTVQDIFRYRYQHGTNLGATFVLERWLRGKMYEPGTVGSSELDAVKRLVSPYEIGFHECSQEALVTSH